MGVETEWAHLVATRSVSRRTWRKKSDHIYIINNHHSYKTLYECTSSMAQFLGYQ